MENNNVTDYSSAFNYLDGVANKYQDSANKLALASLATGLGVSSMGGATRYSNSWNRINTISIN